MTSRFDVFIGTMHLAPNGDLTLDPDGAEPTQIDVWVIDNDDIEAGEIEEFEFALDQGEAAIAKACELASKYVTGVTEL